MNLKSLNRNPNLGNVDYKLHIAIAPTKNIERLEWFIEKATEIGIDEITPLICRFSERKIIKPEWLEKNYCFGSKTINESLFFEAIRFVRLMS